MPAGLRNWRWVWLWWWLWPLAAAAQVPPPDFRGALFIDADGCVRERAGPDWRPRLLPDGGPDCGYPPTPLPLTPPRNSDLPLPPGMPEAEARLLVTMAEGLRPGDFLPAAPAPPAPAPALSHPALSAIEAATSAEGMAARALMAGDRPNARLCALLGQGVAEGAALGADPSRGFCSGPAPQLVAAALRPAAALPARPESAAGEPSERVPAVPTPASLPVMVGGPGAARPSPSPRAVAAGLPVPVAVATSPGPAPALAPSRPAPPTVPGPAAPLLRAEAMIPAGARYLQLGIGADTAAAQAMFARAAGLGLPLARGRVKGGEGILILAGPFDSREAIIRAHARLRAAGFAGLVAR